MSDLRLHEFCIALDVYTVEDGQRALDEGADLLLVVPGTQLAHDLGETFGEQQLVCWPMNLEQASRERTDG